MGPGRRRAVRRGLVGSARAADADIGTARGGSAAVGDPFGTPGRARREPTLIAGRPVPGIAAARRGARTAP